VFLLLLKKQEIGCKNHNILSQPHGKMCRIGWKLALKMLNYLSLIARFIE
jgi:hypothetical protein